MGFSARRIWAGIDAVIVLALAAQYDWSVSLGWSGVSLLWPIEGLIGVATLVGAVGLLVVIASAVAREFRPVPDLRPFPFVRVARPLCFAALAAAAALYILVWMGLPGSDGPSGPADLFGALTSACRPPAPRTLYAALGLSAQESGSAGAFLALLLAAAYLAEKYLRLAWWAGKPRGPFAAVPILPVLLLGLAVMSGLRGEQANRAWVRAQEWAVLPETLAFPEAVSACERQGAGWHLPDRAELARYLGTSPPEVSGVQGKTWTNVLVDGGAGAVVVGLAPPVRGATPYTCGEETHYPDGLIPDAFARLRGWACGWLGSPSRHAASQLPLAVVRAAAVQPVRLPAVCLRAGEGARPAIGPLRPQHVAITGSKQLADLLQLRCADASRPAATCAAFVLADTGPAVGPGVGIPFFAVEQQFDAAEVVFEGMVTEVQQADGRLRAQVMVRRYLKGEGPMVVQLEGLPPEAGALTPRDRRLFFAAGRAQDGVLHAVPGAAMAEVSSDTATVISRKLGPGAPPPFLAAPGPRGPRTTP